MKFPKLLIRYLIGGRRSTRFITLLSFIGVFLASVSMLLTLGIMNGFEKSIKEGILSSVPHITLFVSNEREAEKISLELSKENYIEKAVWFASFGAILQNQNQLSGAVLIGIPFNEQKFFLKNFLIRGYLGKKGIVLGNLLASKLGIYKIPTNVLVIAPMARKTPVGFLPIIKRVKVTGFYSSGIYTFDLEGIGYFKFLKTFLKPTSFQIVLKLKNPYEAEDVKRKLLKKYPQIFILTWIDSNKEFFKAIKLEKLGMILVVSLITLVASFNILSLLITKVKELSRDFAIFRAFGIGKSFIFKLVLGLGLFIGFLGSLFGCFTASLLAFIANKYELIKVPTDIYMTPYLPIIFGWKEILSVITFVVFLSFIASIIPAKMAISEKVTDILRND